jgi:hypothetical protein
MAAASASAAAGGCLSSAIGAAATTAGCAGSAAMHAHAGRALPLYGCHKARTCFQNCPADHCLPPFTLDTQTPSGAAPRCVAAGSHCLCATPSCLDAAGRLSARTSLHASPAPVCPQHPPPLASLPAQPTWITPLCSEARIHGRFGWKDRPFTRLLLVSNLVSILATPPGAGRCGVGECRMQAMGGASGCGKAGAYAARNTAAAGATRAACRPRRTGPACASRPVGRTQNIDQKLKLAPIRLGRRQERDHNRGPHPTSPAGVLPLARAPATATHRLAYDVHAGPGPTGALLNQLADRRCLACLCYGAEADRIQ